MKKKKATNKIIEKVDEIESILDRNYFHTSINIKQQEIEWSIYYRNLPNKVYFSYKNKPLLTSEKNDLSDIYRLNQKFESEKARIFAENIKDFIKLDYEMNRGFYRLTDLFSRFFINVGITTTICAVVNAIFIHSVQFSLMYLLSTCLICFTYSKLSEKARKEIQKTNKKTKEIFIKEKIRKMGLYFLERIKV